MEDKKSSGIAGLLKKIKTEYLILAALVIVAVIVFFGVSGASGDSSEKTQTETVESYVTSLENKLKTCLSKVKGAGKVDVIISVSSSMQTVFATQTTVSGSAVLEAPVFAGGKPVTVKEAYPEIIGVVVVAEGASTLSVKVDILNACQTFLSITEDKIRVLSMK